MCFVNNYLGPTHPGANSGQNPEIDSNAPKNGTLTVAAKKGDLAKYEGRPVKSVRSADGSFGVTHITSAWAGVDQLENAALQGENVRFTFAEAKFPLLDNDGLHGMRQRELAEYFEAGDEVDIRVTFMEYGGGSGVKLTKN